mgnify:CR=1 FL=1
MYLSHKAIDRPRVVIVGVLLIIALAVLTAMQIPVQRTPAINTAVILVYAALRARFADPVRMANVLFFVLLLTLLITLFDRYRQVYLMRFGEGSLYHQRLAKPDAPANL